MKSNWEEKWKIDDIYYKRLRIFIGVRKIYRGILSKN